MYRKRRRIWRVTWWSPRWRETTSTRSRLYATAHGAERFAARQEAKGLRVIVESAEIGEWA